MVGVFDLVELGLRDLKFGGEKAKRAWAQCQSGEHSGGLLTERGRWRAYIRPA